MFEVEIPNLVCGYIFDSQSVAYCSRVNDTLWGHLVFSGHCDLDGAYLILFEVGIPNLVCGCIFGSQSVAYCFKVTVTLSLASVLEK